MPAPAGYVGERPQGAKNLLPYVRLEGIPPAAVPKPTSVTLSKAKGLLQTRATHPLTKESPPSSTPDYLITLFLIPNLQYRISPPQSLIPNP